MSMHDSERLNIHWMQGVRLEFGGCDGVWRVRVSTRGHLTLSLSSGFWKDWSPCSEAHSISLQSAETLRSGDFCCPLPPLPDANYFLPS